MYERETAVMSQEEELVDILLDFIIVSAKTRFEELLAPYIEKPQGKPTLVPESDKRPAYEPAQQVERAKNDFMEEF